MQYNYTVINSKKMGFDAPALAWMPSPPRRPTVTFDLQNLNRLSVGAIEYSLSVLSKLFKAFTRYHGNIVCLDEGMGQQDSPKT